jgi:hypothetical protein
MTLTPRVVHATETDPEPEMRFTYLFICEYHDRPRTLSTSNTETDIYRGWARVHADCEEKR